MTPKQILQWIFEHFFGRVREDMATDTLKLKPYRREVFFSCGPASLKTLFQYYGVSVSEKEIAVIAGTTKENGTSPAGMIKAAERFGFKATSKENCTLADLRYYVNKKIPVIVDWFWEDDGHYGVVIGIDKQNIILRDPSFWKTKKMPIKIFEKVWFDFTGEDRKRKDMLEQLIIVITPKE